MPIMLYHEMICMKCITCGLDTDRYCIYHRGYECEKCHSEKKLETSPPDLVFGPRMGRDSSLGKKSDVEQS